MTPREMELPPTIERKEYQIDAACGVVDQWEAGHHATKLVMPTGTGKTITAGIVAKYSLEHLGRPVLFVAHRTELIQQATNCFQNAFGFATAVEQAQQSEQDYKIIHDGHEPEIVVGTVQSLHYDRLAERYRPQRFGTIIIDESHHSAAPSYQGFLDYFDGYNLLGITATPDGATSNLGKRYNSIAYQLRFTEAISHGYLVPIIARTIHVQVDLREIRTTGGDFNVGDLVDRISPAIEKIAYNIRPHIGQRQTVIFLPDVGSAKAMADMLTQMGTPSEYVAGESGNFGIGRTLREDRLKRYANREFQVICCCELLVEGWDQPAVSCVVVCRPTKKPYKYRQMAGRATRLCPSIGKVDALILDLDWETDRSTRELCKVHTLFAEDMDDNLIESLASEIKRRARSTNKTGDELDVLRLLKELQSDTHKSRLFKVKYTGQRQELYSHYDSDPIGVGRILKIPVSKTRDFDMRGGGPAAKGQVEALRRLGIHGADKMSLWGAGRLLRHLESRAKQGKASHQQVKAMITAGVDETQATELSGRDASSVIAEISIKQKRLFNDD